MPIFLSEKHLFLSLIAVKGLSLRGALPRDTRINKVIRICSDQKIPGHCCETKITFYGNPEQNLSTNYLDSCNNFPLYGKGTLQIQLDNDASSNLGQAWHGFEFGLTFNDSSQQNCYIQPSPEMAPEDWKSNFYLVFRCRSEGKKIPVFVPLCSIIEYPVLKDKVKSYQNSTKII